MTEKEYSAALLASAIHILKTTERTFLMPAANAKAKADAIKKAAKAAKTSPYKHVPQPAFPKVERRILTPDASRGTLSSAAHPPASTQGESDMTAIAEVTKTPQQIAEEKTKAAIAAKEAKLKAAADAKAKHEAEKAAKAKEREEKAAKAKAEREAVAKANAELRAAKAKERADAIAARGPAVTSMAKLAERAKDGSYVKGANGQMHSGDAVAMLLADVPAEKVVALLLEVFEEPNKYEALNYGQQSMNYRNRLRGAIRKGIEVGGTKITLEHVKSIRDAGNYRIQPKPATQPAPAVGQVPTGASEPVTA